MTNTRQEEVAARRAAAIALCRDEQGRVTPRAVWLAARDPQHVLHDEFDWDIKAAAEKHWEVTAARLIRLVKFEVVYKSITIAAPFYVADPRSGAKGYVSTASIARHGALKEKVLRAEMARIVALLNRGLKLAAAFGLVDRFERMLDDARDVELSLDNLGDEPPPRPRPQPPRRPGPMPRAAAQIRQEVARQA
jgi:hypothetical protein